ncbi:hypothetical protein F5887DRAFT_922433 [Amanita rubescens]|nr:hypothetical protein F5887DRAFT_922433 [Amanita rubescens]
MSNTTPAYTSPLALEGWNYVRYVGPLANPQTEPLFLCVRQGELVVAANREPSKLRDQWIVSKLRAEEDDVNRHACYFKHEGTEDYIGHRFPPPHRNGEVVIGPQARFDVLRDPCVPAEECCEEDVGETEPTVDDVPMETDTEVNDANMVEEQEEEPAKPPLDWYLGVSEDLKVVLKSFPVSSEGSSGVTEDRPIWELTTRDEAIDEDHPPAPVPVVRDPRAANNPMRTEYYTRPGRFEAYEKSFWPSGSKPYR